MPISFVIPIQSFKPCLKLTLTSLLALEGLEDEFYEILIIQNGKYITPPEWVLSLPNIVCIHEAEAGISKARNLGFGYSKYELIAFIDEDSICPPEWLYEVRDYFKCHHVGAYQSPASHKSKVSRFEEYYTRSDTYSGLIFFDTAASCFRREALLDVEGFDESFKRVEDLDIAMRMVKRGWMIAFGSVVVPGEDAPSFFNKIYNYYESSYHSIRFHIKHSLPYSVKMFPSDFSLRAKRPPIGVIIERLFFYLLRAPFVAKCHLRAAKRYVIFFEYQKKSTLLRVRVNVMLTPAKVIFLLDRNVVLSTDDRYVYSAIFNSEKIIEINIEQIQDQSFLEKIKPYLWNDEKTIL